MSDIPPRSLERLVSLAFDDWSVCAGRTRFPRRLARPPLYGEQFSSSPFESIIKFGLWYKVFKCNCILGFLCDRMTKKIIKRISPNSQKWPSWTNMVIKCSWEIIKCNGTWYPVLSPAHPLHRYMRFYISKRNGLNVIRSTFFIIPFTLCASWSWLTKFFIRISSHCCSYRLQSI